MEAIGIRTISEIRGSSSGKKLAALTSFYKFAVQMKHRRNSSVTIRVSSVAGLNAALNIEGDHFCLPESARRQRSVGRFGGGQ
jgi:hypothetical protein